MAREPDQAAGRQRVVALVAVGGLAAATALAFGRVFLGRVPTLKLMGAALLSILIASALERRGLVLALLGSLAGLALALTWTVYPQTAWYGLPSLRTLRAIGRSLEFVGRQARAQVAPTPPLPPLMLASVTALWTAAFSTHALAVRAGSPMLAVLPSVALVGFADAVMEDGARPFYAVTLLSAALAVVFVDGLRRIRQWGPIWTSLRSRRAGSVGTRGARRVALIALLAALLVPGLLPGFRSHALVDFSSGGGGGIGLDPFVSIQAQLEDEEPVPLFEVQTEGGAGSYWRLYALNRFNGIAWSSTDPRAEQAPAFQTPVRLPSRLQIPPDAEPLPQRYRILSDLNHPWVPMAYPAEDITSPLGEIRYDEELGAAVLEDGLHEGDQYAVTSRIVAPTPQELDLVRFLDPAEYGGYTFVPASVDPGVGGLARRWTRNQETPYRKVLELQRRFQDGSFTYSLDVEPVADADALLDFLTVSRRGFCQQFATSMATMVRELGYPSRVAVGYRAGAPEGSTFTVDTRDAHAWVEVWFPGYGWLPFEPTPGRVDPVVQPPGAYLDPTAPTDGGQVAGGEQEAGGPLAGSSCTTESGRPLPPQLCTDPAPGGPLGRELGGPLRGAVPTPFEQGAEEEPGYSVPYRAILLVLVLLTAALLVIVPVAKLAWRVLVIRRSREPRDLVLTAYRVFDGRAADLGLGRGAGETLEEHRVRLQEAVSFSDGHLERLTAAAELAAYGPRELTHEESRSALSDSRTALRDLRRNAGWVRRIVGAYRPGL